LSLSKHIFTQQQSGVTPKQLLTDRWYSVDDMKDEIQSLQLQTGSKTTRSFRKK
jgi:hypothetical protein